MPMHPSEPRARNGRQAAHLTPERAQPPAVPSLIATITMDSANNPLSSGPVGVSFPSVQDQGSGTVLTK